jgi:type III secretion system YscQ/HrcQ family protein
VSPASRPWLLGDPRREPAAVWAEWLRRIAPEQALAARRLGTQGPTGGHGDGWRWSWEDVGRPRSAEGLCCATPQSRFWFGLDDWSVLEPALATGLPGLGDAERLAVHEQAAEPLLRLLARWAGGPLLCDALGAPAAGAGSVTLGFVCSEPASGRSSRGWWIGPADALRALPPSPLAAEEIVPLAGLPVSLPVELGRCTLPFGALRTLRCGDVLRMDLPPRAGEVVRVRLPLAPGAAAKALVCRVNQSTLTVETVVSTTFDTTEPPAEDDALALSDLAQVPCTVVFELGRVTLSLAELARVKAGHCFALAVRPSAAAVRIVANGRAVGRGEMVAVGDELAVVVQAIEAPRDVQPA